MRVPDTYPPHGTTWLIPALFNLERFLFFRGTFQGFGSFKVCYDMYIARTCDYSVLLLLSLVRLLLILQ